MPETGMAATVPRLALVLPFKEMFAAHGAGAIALCAHDLVRWSARPRDLIVFGRPVDRPLAGVAFEGVAPAPMWFGPRNRRYVRALADRLHDSSIAVAEVHNRPNYVLWLRRWAPDLTLTLYLHNDPQTMAGADSVAARRQILASTRAIFCVSDYVRDRFLEGLNDDGARDCVHVAPNGIDTEAVAPAPARRQPIFLFVGRMLHDKGVDLFIQALERILPSLPDWRAVLIGAARAGTTEEPLKFERDLRRRAAALGDHIVFEGFRPFDAVVQAYQEAEIAVVPSRWPEPFGRTALEAMAAGCALVSSGTGGLASIGGDAAVAFRSEDADDLAQKLLALATDESRRRAVQSACRARAQAKFDIRTVAGRMDELRTRVLAHQPEKVASL